MSHEKNGMSVQRRHTWSTAKMKRCRRSQEMISVDILWHMISHLVSIYVVCERLSVMQRQTRLPEFFDQIAQNTLFWNLVQNSPQIKI